MERLTLYHEYRLIERNESDVNVVWKGMHLLLFFLAFVFGSFCTFCFHMLMYLFDEKCVLFPKLLSLSSLHHNLIYEFISEDITKIDALPVDFLSTQWIEKSACYFPTYAPLVSGIFGLIWTTMFLMCSTGGRTLTGLQRSWRVIPSVFLFSIAMGGVCIYSSIMTHYGLEQLCVKLGEITGSSSCSYTVNVATLAYERQIRGVYQATRLTILSAWLHTMCWILSALLALLRVVLAVDFQLVRVSVDLVGNMDRMLERYEQHIRTISPNTVPETDVLNLFHSPSYHIHSRSEHIDVGNQELAEEIAVLHSNRSDLLFFADPPTQTSELSLVPAEIRKLSRVNAYQSVPKQYQFIVNIVYDFVDNLELPESPTASKLFLVRADVSEDKQFIVKIIVYDLVNNLRLPKTLAIFTHESSSNSDEDNENKLVARQFGQRHITRRKTSVDSDSAEALNITKPSTSKRTGYIAFEEPTIKLEDEIRQTLEKNLNKRLIRLKQRTRKSNLRNVGSQTAHRNKKSSTSRKVKIWDSIGSKTEYHDESDSDTQNKETQTKPKEKQD